jgi:hypothetical protein
MVNERTISREQADGFKHFERDILLTNPSVSMLARFNGSSGHAGNVEDAVIARADAYKRLADLACRHIEPSTYRALEAMAMNETPLAAIGRDVLGIRNAPQARAAAERTIIQGTWTLGVYYGCITAREPRPQEPG